MSQQQNTSGGAGFTSLLLILFIGLKLGKVIDWSWWWVLSPIWIPLAFVLGIYAIIAILRAFGNIR